MGAARPQRPAPSEAHCESGIFDRPRPGWCDPDGDSEPVREGTSSSMANAIGGLPRADHYRVVCLAQDIASTTGQAEQIAIASSMNAAERSAFNAPE